MDAADAKGDLPASIKKIEEAIGKATDPSLKALGYNVLGDVYLAWENEAWLAMNEFGAGKFEIITPSLSMLAEPPVALVDGNVEAKGTRAVAEAYLAFLYTPKGQGLIARHQPTLLHQDRVLRQQCAGLRRHLHHPVGAVVHPILECGPRVLQHQHDAHAREP